MTTRTIEKKVGKRWEPCFDPNEHELDALHALAADLAAKYIGKATYIRRITRSQRYDGTQVYTVFYDNGCRAIYFTDIY